MAVESHPQIVNTQPGSMATVELWIMTMNHTWPVVAGILNSIRMALTFIHASRHVLAVKLFICIELPTAVESAVTADMAS